MNKVMQIIIGVVAVLAVGAFAVYRFFFYVAPEVHIAYSVGDSFQVNIAGEDRRYFKFDVALTIDTDDEKVVEHLKENSAVIRDTIIFIVRSYTLAELQELTTHEKIRQEIMNTLNERLEFERIIDVLFTDYMIQ